ncbi:MAG: hypothetical protein LBQ92_05545 [Propionibacteriaceae bacterium]|jgi:hypothetical protein|nr:hypothetical protein [Propionibacteriaceae bacterium]
MGKLKSWLTVLAVMLASAGLAAAGTTYARWSDTLSTNVGSLGQGTLKLGYIAAKIELFNANSGMPALSTANNANFDKILTSVCGDPSVDMNTDETVLTTYLLATYLIPVQLEGDNLRATLTITFPELGGVYHLYGPDEEEIVYGEMNPDDPVSVNAVKGTYKLTQAYQPDCSGIWFTEHQNTFGEFSATLTQERG